MTTIGKASWRWVPDNVTQQYETGQWEMVSFVPWFNTKYTIEELNKAWDEATLSGEDWKEAEK